MAITLGNVEIVVRTRSEHCPPHVHADCLPEGWSARFMFGFLSDDVAFWDFQPANPKRPPKMPRLDEVGEAVFKNLAAIRERWWQVMRTTCLENRYVKVVPDGLALIDGRAARGTPQVRAASYAPVDQTLAVTLTDGSQCELDLKER